MLRIPALLFFLLPFTCFAQYVITGKVVNIDTKAPVADASVFLSNATVGSKSAENGSFILTNVRPGQYDLVISVVGYETFHQTVMVNGDLSLQTLAISAKTILLKEVKIAPNANWQRDYETFKRLFLGGSENAAQCKILNSDILSFDFDNSTKVFTATATDFLEIENKALGYKVKYLLSDFSNDNKSGILYVEGSVLFEELKGSKAQQNRWQKKRLEAYLGSTMHFLRSSIGNSWKKDGFVALRLIRKPNPAYKGGSKNKYTETLVAAPLFIGNVMWQTTVKGQYALGYTDCLYVLYNPHKFNDLTTPSVPDYLNEESRTIITFLEPYAYFDNNGIVINPRSIIFEGLWAKGGVADLLPVDYVPPVEKK
jgi:hypothetical protein